MWAQKVLKSNMLKTELKSFKFQDVQYSVYCPRESQWIAADSDGRVWVYEGKPESDHEDTGIWIHADGYPFMHEIKGSVSRIFEGHRYCSTRRRLYPA